MQYANTLSGQNAISHNSQIKYFFVGRVDLTLILIFGIKPKGGLVYKELEGFGSLYCKNSLGYVILVLGKNEWIMM